MIVRSASRYAIARGVPGLVNFLGLALFTRLLSEREYGIYALVAAGVALAYALCLQWLSLAVMRLVSAAPDRQAFLATVLRTFVPLVLLVMGVGLILGAWLGRVSPLALMSGAALLVCHSWFDLNLNLATADSDPGRYGMLAAVRSTVGVGVGATLAFAGAGPSGVLAGAAVGAGSAGLLAAARSWRGTMRLPAQREIRSALLTFGLPLSGAYVLEYVVSSSDRLLLGAMVSPETAGLYAPAYDLCQQSLWALMMVVNLAAYPLAVAAVERGDRVAQDRHFRQHILFLVAVALPAATGLAVLAPSISHLFGGQFADAARVLIPILAPAVLLGGLKSYYFDLSFQLGHATRMQLLTVAIGAFVNLLLNLWWIPMYGMRGAAYATLTAYGVVMLGSWWFGRRVLPLPLPLAGLARVGVATLLMALVLYQVREVAGPLVLAWQVPLGVAVYGLTLLGFARGRVREVLTP